MTTDLQQQLQETLSDLVIQRELGGGGMSRVFLAEERQLGRRVVVKVLSPALGAGMQVERFEREIRLAARLQDPRIVPLLQAGHVGHLPYYTMPYVDGESLRQRLDRSRPSPEEALGFLRDVALALEYAHAHQVVHRDIKPQNILLSGRTALVADFGIAKAIDAATLAGSGSVLTSIGSIVGTPAYMAPEQGVGDPVDPRTDLYSWGVIAFEMLAGAHPFASHTTAQAMLAAHIAERPASLAKQRPDLPARVTAVVDSCLAKDPNRRPRNASALLAELNAPAAPAVTGRIRLTLRNLVAAGLAILLLAATGWWFYSRSQGRRWAREQAIGESGRLDAADQPLAAFLLLKRAARHLPSDSQIARDLDQRTRLVSVASSPPGATVQIQDYLATDSGWYSLGATPLNKVRIPDGYFRWKISKPGVGEYVTAPLTDDAMWFPLDTALHAPDGMVRVGAGRWGEMISFVGWLGPYDLPAFYLDRFEVTNRQYQEFVDSGGYRDPKYWRERFQQRGHELTREQAMALFRDGSGRAGPSTWEAGHYPDGQADYPVSGVSWYEASAYAVFAGKSLPTLAQWYQAASADAGFTVRASNISRPALAPVGGFRGLGAYGTYDMAGNVREWALNALDADRRFVLGGNWKSQTYLFFDPEAFSPFDRSAGNGIRCVRNLGPLPPDATRPIKPFDRDFSKYRPATDDVFRAYQVMYAYGHLPLNAKAEGVVQDTPDWREERITFDAAYGNERLTAYLFLPKKVKPPYQTVVFFPSARVLGMPLSETLGDVDFFDYVVRSGRAVLYPIYQDTYERRVRHTMPGAGANLVVTAQRAKDLGRSIDYLRSRPDIARDQLGYLGVSMGAAEGVIYATLEQDRLQAIVFLDGGFFLAGPRPGGDQADFAPRLKKPVLMVNGRYDFTFSLARSQLPLFRMLGTPAAQKRHVVLETPHDVRADRANLVKEVLTWLDTYLGRVN